MKTSASPHLTHLIAEVLSISEIGVYIERRSPWCCFKSSTTKDWREAHGEEGHFIETFGKGMLDHLSLRGASGPWERRGGACPSPYKLPTLDKNPGKHSTQNGFMCGQRKAITSSTWGQCLWNGAWVSPCTDWVAFRCPRLAPSSHLPLREDSNL